MPIELVAVLQLLVLVAGSGSKLPDKKFNVSSLVFPKGFVFGTATASYQVEGGWNEGGKGENIWDRLVHTNPTAIANNDTGDIACDSYHKFKEDVQNIKTIGFKMYRFSLSWSRLFPDGFITKPNPDGVRYYNELIDELLSNGIEPMVTLYHWDLPQPLQDFGGWLNPDMADIFAEYARAVFELFGERVKWWVTLNEPISAAKCYGDPAGGAPLLNLHGVGEYAAGHNMLRAHAKVYRLYEREFKSTQKGKLSLSLTEWFMFPKNASDPYDVAAAERGMQFSFGWFMHPILGNGGDYPPIMREMVDRNSRREGRQRSRLPRFTKEEIHDLKGSADYIALNHYSSRLATTGLTGQDPSSYRDSEVIQTADETWPATACSDWFWVVPEGLKGLLRWLRKEYNNPEIFITEQGYCGTPEGGDEGKRADYFTSYLSQILEAIKEGSNVVGYTVWSLMDNFEWMDGYTKRFGIIHVDFNDPNRTRTFKDSAALFRQIIDLNSQQK